MGESRPSFHELGAPPEQPLPVSAPELHPSVRAQRSTLKEATARLAAARAAFLPRLELAAAAWMRAGNWPSGAAMEVAPNWAVGVILDVPLIERARQAADARAAAAEKDAAQARLEGMTVDVAGQLAEAEALLEAARRAEAQSKDVVSAAQGAHDQAIARFEAGLIDVTLVATTQTRAREAELAALSAHFDVLSTALARDYARGDLSLWMGGKP
jgi:outer membrane protein TolC